jgi:hypothetical protein
MGLRKMSLTSSRLEIRSAAGDSTTTKIFEASAWSPRRLSRNCSPFITGHHKVEQNDARALPIQRPLRARKTYSLPPTPCSEIYGAKVESMSATSGSSNQQGADSARNAARGSPQSPLPQSPRPHRLTPHRGLPIFASLRKVALRNRFGESENRVGAARSSACSSWATPWNLGRHMT